MKTDYEKYKENLGTEWLINSEDGIIFYEYPENPIYWISKCGKVYNALTDRMLKQTIIQSGKGYYTVTVNKKRTRVHRMLAITFLNNPHGYELVDHLNVNTLDNSLENLRWATASMNSRNRRKQPNKTSKYFGVCKLKNNKFTAKCLKKYLGTFETEELAALAYNNYAAQHDILNLNKL